MNFYDVEDYGETKAAITAHMREHFPTVEFVVSNDYETTFDQLSE